LTTITRLFVHLADQTRTIKRDYRVRFGGNPPFRYQVAHETWESELEIEVCQHAIDSLILKQLNNGPGRATLTTGPLRIKVIKRKLIGRTTTEEAESCTSSESAL
jgi:hypothetical protein